MDLISILFSYSPSSYSLVIFYLTNFYVLTHSLTHSLLTTYSQALYMAWTTFTPSWSGAVNALP